MRGGPPVPPSDLVCGGSLKCRPFSFIAGPIAMTSPAPSPLIAQFQRIFGRAPAVVARAPGRIEFIGNHTDYNGGAVLGAAIDRYVWVVAAANPDGRMRFFSDSTGTVLELPEDREARFTGADSWANYPLGVWRSLQDIRLPRPAGFDLLVASNLPVGAGLSSSAALELAVALALLGLKHATIPPAQLAALGRHAENKYVGVPCGILDQGTSAFGQADHLVHIDCRGPTFSLVPLPHAAHLWIFNTREKHALIDGLYATRHRECQEAATALDVGLLADLTPAQFRGARAARAACGGGKCPGGGNGGGAATRRPGCGRPPAHGLASQFPKTVREQHARAGPAG